MNQNKWAQTGWRPEQKYANKVLLGNWAEERLQVGILAIYFYFNPLYNDVTLANAKGCGPCKKGRQLYQNKMFGGKHTTSIKCENPFLAADPKYNVMSVTACQQFCST